MRSTTVLERGANRYPVSNFVVVTMAPKRTSRMNGSEGDASVCVQGGVGEWGNWKQLFPLLSWNIKIDGCSPAE